MLDFNALNVIQTDHQYFYYCEKYNEISLAMYILMHFLYSAFH